MYQKNRRQTPRHEMALPLLVRLENSFCALGSKAVSSNVSHRGVYFATHLPVKIGTRMEILMTMPEVIVGRPVREWRCHARVVRIDAPIQVQNASGVGVEFIYYEVLRNRATILGAELPVEQSAVA